MLPCLALALVLAPARSEPPPPAPLDSEAPYLAAPVQLTFPADFVRAGEAYFDPTASWIIFQAIPRPPAGSEPSKFYAMYAARLRRDPATGRPTGLDTITRLSPDGSADTCGWFHPAEPGRVLFGATLTPPDTTHTPGYSRDRSRYEWEFPEATEIVTRLVRPVYADTAAQSPVPLPLAPWPPDAETPTPIFTRPGYDAEGSWSPDGRCILYTHVEPGENDPNIWLFDTRTGAQTPLVTAKGYDGGPFFSPDGRRITYRSDRRADNLLQLFVADLAFDDPADPARPTGIRAEHQLTDDQNVNWAPFWHPSGRYLVFASSAIGHRNYEVFAIEADPGPAGARRTARITHAEGFDGLPAFSPDGRLLMWTSQRAGAAPGEERPSSQLWIADVHAEPAWAGPPAPRATP